MSIAPGMARRAWLSISLTVRSVLVCAVCLGISATTASAQSIWQGSTPFWNDPANWSTNSIPDQNSQLQFASATASLITNNNIATPSPLLVNSISVLSTAPGPILISGNPFTAQNGIDVAAGQSLTVSSGIGTSGSPASNLTISGSGTTELIGNPTFAANAQIQGGTVFVNTTHNGPMFVNSAAANLGGYGTITGNLTVNGGNVAAGTGVGDSTLTVGGSFTVNGTVNVRLFGTGYTNANNSDIGKLDVGGSALVNSLEIRLDLSLLSASQANQLRSDTLANGPFRDYTIISTTGGFSGALPTLNIVDAGSFDPNEWTLLPVSGGDLVAQLRFQPVPEPTSIVGVLAAGACLFGFAKRRKRKGTD